MAAVGAWADRGSLPSCRAAEAPGDFRSVGAGGSGAWAALARARSGVAHSARLRAVAAYCVGDLSGSLTGTGG
jgi:hypothetical protein